MKMDEIENLRTEVILAAMKLAIKRPIIKFVEDTNGQDGKLVLVPTKDLGQIGYGAYNRRALVRTVRWLRQMYAVQQQPRGRGRPPADDFEIAVLIAAVTEPGEKVSDLKIASRIVDRNNLEMEPKSLARRVTRFLHPEKEKKKKRKNRNVGRKTKIRSIA
jgi:hypothetical protein